MLILREDFLQWLLVVVPEIEQTDFRDSTGIFSVLAALNLATTELILLLDGLLGILGPILGDGGLVTTALVSIRLVLLEEGPLSTATFLVTILLFVSVLIQGALILVPEELLAGIVTHVLRDLLDGEAGLNVSSTLYGAGVLERGREVSV